MNRPFKVKDHIAFKSEEDIDDFIRKFEKFSFEIDFIDSNLFRFKNTPSFEGGNINYRKSKPVYIFGYKRVTNDKWFFVLESRFRSDNVILTFLLTMSVLFVGFGKAACWDCFSFWLKIFVLLGVVFFYNWFVYIQEKGLLRSITAAIKTYKLGQL